MLSDRALLHRYHYAGGSPAAAVLARRRQSAREYATGKAETNQCKVNHLSLRDNFRYKTNKNHYLTNPKFGAGIRERKFTKISGFAGGGSRFDPLG